MIEVARLRRTTATPREQGEAKAGVFEQRRAVARERRHHRHLMFGQLQAELVLLEDRRIAPAGGAVELGDQRFGILDAHLVDAVLIAVERQYTGVAEKAEAFHGIED